MPRQNEIDFTFNQIKLLKQIHQLARQMEALGNSGRVHAVIALLEELSNEYIDIIYFVEKANLLFNEKITIE